MLSHKMREVIMRPNELNIDSRSGCVMFFGNPETYRLAPLIASELGRANETYAKHIKAVFRMRMTFKTKLP